MPFHMFQLLPGIINLRLEFRLAFLIVVVDIILFHAHAAARQMVEYPPNWPGVILEPILVIIWAALQEAAAIVRFESTVNWPIQPIKIWVVRSPRQVVWVLGYGFFIDHIYGIDLIYVLEVVLVHLKLLIIFNLLLDVELGRRILKVRGSIWFIMQLRYIVERIVLFIYHWLLFGIFLVVLEVHWLETLSRLLLLRIPPWWGLSFWFG